MGEIIKHLRASREETPVESRVVVFISRDQKADWVSAAPYVLNFKGEPQKCNRDEGMDLTEAHPFLVHELVGVAGGERLYITQPGFLASVIDFGFRRKQQPTQVAQWLAAAYRPDVL